MTLTTLGYGDHCPTSIAGRVLCPLETVLAEAIFNRMGHSMVIPESQMQAATVICASGIAFWMRLIRATTQGAIQLGFDNQKTSRVNQPDMGRFTKVDSEPKRFVREIRLDDRFQVWRYKVVVVDKVGVPVAEGGRNLGDHRAQRLALPEELVGAGLGQPGPTASSGCGSRRSPGPVRAAHAGGRQGAGGRGRGRRARSRATRCRPRSSAVRVFPAVPRY